MDGKILLIRGGALGDFILTLPVLAALRRRFPERRMEILGYPSVASLAVAGGLADEVFALESPRLAGLFGEGGTCPPETAAWLAGFEIIISYVFDPKKVFQSNVGRHSTARFIAGPHRPDETRPAHATEQLLEPLRAVGIDDPDPRPRLILPGSAGASGQLAAHPGSGSERKNWLEAHWQELLQLLTVPVLLIGGEAEGGRCARLGAALPAGRAEVAQNLPLIDLAKRMRGCRAFIGHDSGITHLAAALGLRGLALWGETVLTTWRPQSDRVKIVRARGGLTALSVAAVWEELQTLL